jgi:hypothetical protein
MASVAPKPSVDAGRVISRGFEALKPNFLPFFALALLLVGVPGFLGQYLLLSGFETMDPAFIFSGAYWWPVLASFFGTFLGTTLLQGLLTRSAILTLGGRDPDLGGSAILALRLLLPIIGLSICVGIILMCGFIFLIVPGIIFWCALSVAVPALVEERQGVFASIGRSRELTRGSRLHIFLLGFLFWILSMVISGVAGGISGLSSWNAPGLPNAIFSGIATGAGTALSSVISTVVIAALYVELREVREGTSTNQLADVFG